MSHQERVCIYCGRKGPATYCGKQRGLQKCVFNTPSDKQTGNQQLESMFPIGARVRLLEDIWDDGEDHHPPGYLARRGEELIVRKHDPGHELPICVSHEDRHDNSFRVKSNEIEVL